MLQSRAKKKKKAQSGYIRSLNSFLNGPTTVAVENQEGLSARARYKTTVKILAKRAGSNFKIMVRLQSRQGYSLTVPFLRRCPSSEFSGLRRKLLVKRSKLVDVEVSRYLTKLLELELCKSSGRGIYHFSLAFKRIAFKSQPINLKELRAFFKRI